MTRLFVPIAFILISACMIAALLAMIAGRGFPLGEQVAYVSKPQNTVWDIYLLDIDRALSFNLTGPFMPRPIRNRLPTWSPDGERLAFVSELRRGMDILVMDVDALWLQALSDQPRDESFPSWSNSPIERIAYAVFNGDNWDVQIRRVSGADVWLAQSSYGTASPAGDRLPVWSPDGRTLAFVSNRLGVDDIFLADVDGRNARPLTRGMGVGDYLVWSPDGSHIAFVLYVGGSQEIYVVEVATRRIRNTSNHRATDYAPAWSPDGRWIAFVSDRDGDDELYLMDAEGGSLRQLTHNRAYDYAPQWSADSTRLIYVSVPELTSEIYILDIADGRPHRLTFNYVDDWSPLWRP